MPPMREGSTERVASIFRPDACAIFAMMSSASARLSSRAVTSSTSSTRSSSSDEPLELAPDLGNLAQPPLLRQQAEEVAKDGVGLPEDRVEPGLLGPYVDLRVEQEPAQLGGRFGRLDEVAEVRPDLVEPPGVLRRAEQRLRVDALGYGHW